MTSEDTIGPFVCLRQVQLLFFVFNVILALGPLDVVISFILRRILLTLVKEPLHKRRFILEALELIKAVGCEHVNKREKASHRGDQVSKGGGNQSCSFLGL